MPSVTSERDEEREKNEEKDIPQALQAASASTETPQTKTLPDRDSLPVDLEASYVLSEDQVKPLIRIGKGEKEKIINGFGLWTVVVSLITGPLWVLAMSLVQGMYSLKDRESWDPHSALFDATGKVWAKTWLGLAQSYPSVSGDLQRLSSKDEPCLFVANHASWLDIPVLCTVLDPVFKFIAKGELTNVPCVGQQLKGGNHVLIDREDRRSQLRTFKEGLGYLKSGVPLMAFPEGQRSKDGKLMKFKGGIFSMAVKAQVPIVCLSLSHTHAVMPANSLFPVQSGSGKLHVHVHDPIDTAEKTEDELAEIVRDTLLSMMPRQQYPVA